MYAKLIYNGTTTVDQYSPSNVIRDIVRLCTSQSPNVGYLVGFSNTSSVIIDTTPAGWSTVYSNVDGTSLPEANSDPAASSNTAGFYWAMSAPCLGPASNTTKYVKLTTSNLGDRNWSFSTSNPSGFSLTSAVSVTDTGTVTGEGYRIGLLNNGSSIDSPKLQTLDLNSNGTYHIVATPRHLTIIKEGVGYHAVWEHSVTDYHTFYNIAPVIHSIFKGTNAVGPNSTAPASTAPVTSNPPAAIPNNIRCLHNITDVNAGTNYSAITIAGQENQPYLSPSTYYTNMRTVSVNGTTRNIVTPMMFQLMQWGVPTCFITSVCDIYMTQGNIGTTGDTFTINGSTYIYFNCGSTGLAIGTF